MYASPLASVWIGIFVCFNASSFAKSKKTYCVFLAAKMSLKPMGGLESGALWIVYAMPEGLKVMANCLNSFHVFT